MIFFFFFKQKTAYELRISDWSSDVCSSDLFPSSTIFIGTRPLAAMLQLIRSQVTSIFVKILFVLLIVSFAIWGIGDVFFGSPVGKVAIEIGDEVGYTSQEVAAEFESARRRIGVPITAEQALMLGVLDQVMNEMVNEGVLTDGAPRLDLEVDERAQSGGEGKRVRR